MSQCFCITKTSLCRVNRGNGFVETIKLLLFICWIKCECGEMILLSIEIIQIFHIFSLCFQDIHKIFEKLVLLLLILDFLRQSHKYK